MTTLLVAGPRDWTSMIEEFRLWDALEKFQENYGLDELVHGGAAGADTIANKFAATRPEMKVSVFRPEWDRLGRKAGPVRNKAMVEYVTGQALEHGVANVFAMLCHRDVWTPGTASTHVRLVAQARTVPVLLTHVTRERIYEEAM